MTSIIHFGCPGCGRELATPPDTPVARCQRCAKEARLGLSPALKSGSHVDVCALCGHPDLYVQKDFNRALGLVIVILGCLASVVLFAMREPVLAFGSLVAMALIDLVIYALVPLVTVCYSCHAIYRGFGPNPEHHPFDLELLERYGGRTPRR